jgi:hypothetical protein
MSVEIDAKDMSALRMIMTRSPTDSPDGPPGAALFPVVTRKEGGGEDALAMVTHSILREEARHPVDQSCPILA